MSERAYEKFHLAEDEWEEPEERDPDVAHDREKEEQEWLK